MKKLLFVLACFFIFPLTSLALDVNIGRACPKNTGEAFKKAFEEVNISYSFIGYNEKNKKPIYNINITNIHPNIKVSTEYGAVKKNNNVTEVNIRANKPGNLEVFLAANYKNPNYKYCTMYAKETIILPNYNPYYSREECNGLTAYDVCKRWGNFSGNENDFKKAIEAAKKDLENKNVDNEKTKVKRVKHWYTYISNIFVKYWWAIIIVVVLVSGIFYSIRLKNKKNEYNFKL